MFNEMGNNDPLRNLLEQLKQDDSVIRAKLNDERLIKLAEYDASNGFMITKISPEVLQDKFCEFKRMVKTGDFTLKSLEDDVYNRWGVQEDTREQVLNKEKGTTNSAPVITGFNVGDLETLDLPEDSPENH